LIRLLLRLFGIKDFDLCKSCETLKQQLEYERDEKQRLTDTLLSIIKPKTYEAPPQELQPIATTAGLFSRRRSALEERDRLQARILQDSKHLGKPDNLKNIKSIDKLEQELGIEEMKEAKETNG
jgi:hypothetical protein